MRDTVITARTKRREAVVLTSCLLAAVLLNVYAIVSYHRPWTELFSQIGYVVVIAVVWAMRRAIMFFSWLFGLLRR